jgi:DNA-3-methyladenine glycosylase
VRATAASARHAAATLPATATPARPDPATPALPGAFFARPVVEVARDLVGCVVSHGELAGTIVEAEAYHEAEPACHAFVGLTPRTRTLFGPAGRAYVYRSYGIHAMLNAVCEDEDTGAAVLIRALEPLAGIAEMRRRRGLDRVEELCSGPGKLTQALGIELHHDGIDLAGGPIRIHPPPPDREPPELTIGPRSGITKAADLPWRFCVAGNPHVSRPRPPGSAKD